MSCSSRNSGMDSTDIESVLLSNPVTARYFNGVFAADRLPVIIPSRPGYFAANLDESWKMGSHWTLVFCPDLISGGGVEYFCSLGQTPINHYFMGFVSRNGGYASGIRHHALQSHLSDVCGEFSCTYAYFRCSGFSENDYYNYFGMDRLANDKSVVSLFNSIFTCKTHFYRASLRDAQLCHPLCHRQRGQRCPPPWQRAPRATGRAREPEAAPLHRLTRGC